MLPLDSGHQSCQKEKEANDSESARSSAVLPDQVNDSSPSRVMEQQGAVGQMWAATNNSHEIHAPYYIILTSDSKATH